MRDKLTPFPTGRSWEQKSSEAPYAESRVERITRVTSSRLLEVMYGPARPATHRANHRFRVALDDFQGARSRGQRWN